MYKGNKQLELSAGDVSILVKLIKENKTTNVKKLNLELLHPNLYEKLDKVCFNKAYNARVIHRLLKDYQNDYFEDNFYGLMYYCEDNLGFSYKFKPEEYFDEVDLEDYYDNPEDYEDEIDEVTYDHFSRWFYNYLEDLSDDEARDFFFNIISEDIEDGFVDYTVKIPQSIIKIARGQTS